MNRDSFSDIYCELYRHFLSTARMCHAEKSHGWLETHMDRKAYSILLTGVWKPRGQWFCLYLSDKPGLDYTIWLLLNTCLLLGV